MVQKWHPGQELGIDTFATHRLPALYASKLHDDCQITFVDLLEDDINYKLATP